MYGAEHGFLLHALMVFGSWLAFFLICAAPIALVALVYWLGVRSGRLSEPIVQSDHGRSPESRQSTGARR